MEDNTNSQIINNNNEIQNWLNLLEQPFHTYNFEMNNYEEVPEETSPPPSPPSPSPNISPQHSEPTATSCENYGAAITSKTQETKKSNVKWEGDRIAIRKASKNNEKKKGKEKKLTTAKPKSVQGRRRAVGGPKAASAVVTLSRTVEKQSVINDTPQQAHTVPTSPPPHQPSDNVVTGIQTLRNLVDQKTTEADNNNGGGDGDFSSICGTCKKIFLNLTKKPRSTDGSSAKSSIFRKRNNDVQNILKTVLEADLKESKNINFIIL